MVDWNGDGRKNELDHWDIVEDTRGKNSVSSRNGGRLKSFLIVALICLIIAGFSPALAKLLLVGYALTFIAFP